MILVSVDGLAHYYFDDPKAHMPTIRAMAAKGARAKRMEASYPTVTWPNHTSLVTGVHAGRHGVIGNTYYDRAQNKVIPLIPDPLFDKAEIVMSPTIYDVVYGAGLTTAETLKVVMTGSADDGPDWQPHIRSKDKRRKLANRFKDAKDPFRIVIVRDMWLTGFDAPCLHTMYADKPM